jgi:hypothetical protein
VPITIRLPLLLFTFLLVDCGNPRRAASACTHCAGELTLTSAGTPVQIRIAAQWPAFALLQSQSQRSVRFRPATFIGSSSAELPGQGRTRSALMAISTESAG